MADLSLEGLVHDLNNVFQTIAESADLLRNDTKWDKLARTLQRSVDRGQRIANSILETNRSGADLFQVVENSIQFCEDSWEYANGPKMTMARELDPEFRLKGDPDQWERVLVNLFLNSAQAGAKHIRIQARGKQIVVSDDGPGIAPQVLEKIFQERVSTKPIISGLGLYVVRSIVEQYGGTVTASNGPHGGAVFTIQI